MASKLADNCRPPPTKRLKGIPDPTESDTESSRSCLESPVNDLSSYRGAEGKLKTIFL